MSETETPALSNTEMLKEIETKLRQKETDRIYLTSQLQLLAAILAHDGTNESGLVRGALGGMYYCLKRLREIWKEEGVSEPPSAERLQEIYAEVELSRYALTDQARKDTMATLRRDCMMANMHELTLSDGRKVWVFASANDQHTVDGRQIARGELLEASSTMVASFDAYYRALQKELEKKR